MKEKDIDYAYYQMFGIAVPKSDDAAPKQAESAQHIHQQPQDDNCQWCYGTGKA